VINFHSAKLDDTANVTHTHTHARTHARTYIFDFGTYIFDYTYIMSNFIFGFDMVNNSYSTSTDLQDNTLK